MAIFNWDGASNLDLKILGQSFDFRSDVLQVSDPSLAASQFDLVEVGTDLAIVKSRDATGAPLAAADVRYAYIPNMIIRQVGVDASDASQNIVLSNGGQLWVGQRDTDTVLDDSGNVVPLSSALQSVQVWGLGGADTISTGDGADRVYGNTGADVISGGGGNDSLYGGQDNDAISGGGGNDQIAGDLGNDTLNGNGGNDILYGGAGNDVIDPDTGNDTIFAGNGNDTVTVGNSDTGDKLIYMDKMQDLVYITSTTGDHLVYLGENNDTATLTANAGDIEVYGDGGNDTISSGNFGEDTLDGGVDDDYLTIQDGAIGLKTLIGGDGKDRIDIDDTTGHAFPTRAQPDTQIHVSAGEGADTIDYARGLFIADQNDGGTGNDLIGFDQSTSLVLRDLSIQNIETIYFSSQDDYVVFADGNNGGGTVTVYADHNLGGFGADTIDARAESSGSYVIFGENANDSLFGGAGADTLNGGDGIDYLNGGGGADVYQIDNFQNNGFQPGGFSAFDRISLGAGDTIRFESETFDDVASFSGYKGQATSGIAEYFASTNLYILTGEDYVDTNDVYSQFFTDALNISIDEVASRPIFFVYFDQNASTSDVTSGTGRAVVYYVDQTENWDGTEGAAATQAHLVAILDNITNASQMDGLSLDQFGFY